ncbi:response regulator [Mucilaginibacter sp.]|uniref:response regulator n=1 Tax=Mucilaginibacter sp. TaxID=1882438 RepID=UPI00261CBA1B|nr:response regulator [Mucilaginibacter sp.]MDB4926706.1 chemotaxis-specific methylesterase [Mucilaginibacter sp.]
MELSFIIIDDTELDHFIAKRVITNRHKTAHVKSFMDATLALEHIIEERGDASTKVTLVFLDIYMPIMNGFQFIEEFEKFHPDIQDKYYIVALTSSREVSDINRIKSYRSFKTWLTKPITAEALSVLLNKICKEFNIQLPE